MKGGMNYVLNRDKEGMTTQIGLKILKKKDIKDGTEFTY